MILYSIIIAVYNVEKYLEECLDSILEQSYPNWEVILVDDGSSDEGTGRICDEYVKKDARFKVFHRKNEGSLMARRFGMQQSSGEYILCVDSDDYIHKDLLKEVDKIIKTSQSDLVIYRFRWVSSSTSTDSEIIFPEGTILEQDKSSRQKLWKRVLTCNSLNNLCLKVAKRECFDIEEDYSKYALLKSGTDFMQSLPILDSAKKIYFTEKIFYFYRQNDSGISAQKAKKVNLRAIDKYFKDKDILMEKRLFFLKKNNVASEKNLSLHYTSCFNSSMEILVSWLANEPNRKKRRQIVQRAMQEKSLIECKKYIKIEDLSGYNRYLYQLFVDYDFRKFSILLNILVIRRKVILFKGSVIEKVAKRQAKSNKIIK